MRPALSRFIGVGCLAMALATAPSSSSESQGSAVRSILLNRHIWGRDFPAALMSLQGWRGVGESTVAVFANRIVGAKPYPQREEALPQIKRLEQEIAKPRAPFKAEFSALQNATPDAALKVLTPAVVRFEDDQSHRLAVTFANAEFLKANLTLKDVEAELGPADSVTKQVISGEGERRPVVLTLHHYAGGAIDFVQWDLDAHPGRVNRVLLAIPAVSEMLFKGAP